MTDRLISYDVENGFWKEKDGRLKDRMSNFLKPLIDTKVIFDNLSDGYLEKTGMAGILGGVPIPIEKSQLDNLSTVMIGKGMAFVIGCDVNFKFRDNYLTFIRKLDMESFVRGLVSEGVFLASKGDFLDAMVFFRGAMLIDPTMVDALYCYGRALSDAYAQEGAKDFPDFIGACKGDALEAFELVTILSPDFDMGYYYLGYGYMNLGLYLKAKLTFDEFLRLSQDKKLREEIVTWQLKLEDPVKIEKGYNEILRGNFEAGLEVILPYSRDKRFATWWPIWYYMAVAYGNLKEDDKAIEVLKELLKLSPSNSQGMELLVELYRRNGNDELVAKYEKKLKVVADNAELDRLEMAKMEGAKLS